MNSFVQTQFICMLLEFSSWGRETQQFNIHAIFSVLALKCQECADISGYPSSFSSCTSQDIKSIECTSPGFDSCMTFKMTVQVPGEDPLNAEMRNCSSRSLFCDKNSNLDCKWIFAATILRSVLLSSLPPYPLPSPLMMHGRGLISFQTYSSGTHRQSFYDFQWNSL